MQTVFPSLPLLRLPRPPLFREMLELPDGDVTVVDWLTEIPSTTETSPLLIVLHGLESSAKSTYARQLLHAAAGCGWRAAVLHFRDCGDYRNRLPRRYHAGETSDLRYFLHKLRTDGHDGPLLAAGYSLGGNVLLKYLGESAAETPLLAAAAVSVPLNLHESSKALSNGISRFYQTYLLRRMKRSVLRKFNPHTAAFDWNKAMTATTFLTQRQLMAKNMPADALSGPYAQQQKMMLYMFPVIYAVTTIFIPIGVLMYWLTTNIWTMAQQGLLIRNNPAPNTPAYLDWEDRIRAKGKDPDQIMAERAAKRRRTKTAQATSSRGSSTASADTDVQVEETTEDAAPRIQRQAVQRQTIRTAEDGKKVVRRQPRAQSRAARKTK